MIDCGTCVLRPWESRDRGRGVATAACRRLTESTLAKPGVLRIEAGVFHPNLASARVLEKCGYVREGTMRRAIIKRDDVYDLHLYARVRE